MACVGEIMFDKFARSLQLFMKKWQIEKAVLDLPNGHRVEVTTRMEGKVLHWKNLDVKCGNCGSFLKATKVDMTTAAPYYCETCGIPYNADGTEFDDAP